jgi:1-acyl-sn-glycerol-3-phosphate acyltransferase
MILTMPFVLLSYIFFSGKKASDFAFIFLNIWAFGFNMMMGYRYKVTNRQLVNKNQAYIFVANHSSYLDAVTLVRIIPQSFKPLGKVEMLKVPIFGTIYKRLVVLIDRSSKESRERCVIELKKEIANGQSILIFPEGTMNTTDDLLANFYDGAFRIAIETQTPILPLTIINTKELLPRKDPTAIKNGLIHCVVSEEISPKGLTNDDLASLKEQVFKEMESQLIKYKASA